MTLLIDPFDLWAFLPLDESIPNSLTPCTQMGIIYTRQEWNAIRAAVDLYFANTTDTDVALWNMRREVFLEEARTQRDSQKSYRPKKYREGSVYLLRSESGHYKVGKSTNPHNRNRTIGTQMPHETTLLYTAQMDSMGKAEELLHSALSDWHVNGEWFDLPDNVVHWIMSGTWLDTCGLRDECKGEARHE
jgi:hypothetical protein